jgi:hypothetical protein
MGNGNRKRKRKEGNMEKWRSESLKTNGDLISMLNVLFKTFYFDRSTQ